MCRHRRSPFQVRRRPLCLAEVPRCNRENMPSTSTGIRFELRGVRARDECVPTRVRRQCLPSARRLPCNRNVSPLVFRYLHYAGNANDYSDPSIPLPTSSVGMRESFGDQSGVENTSVSNTYGDHSIIVLNLTLVDVVELLAAVLLADPPSPTIVVNDLFNI